MVKVAQSSLGTTQRAPTNVVSAQTSRTTVRKAADITRALRSSNVLWGLVIFFGSFLFLQAANGPLIERLPTSGDEPWYLLQGYSILHHHTVDLARVLQDHDIYRAFLGGVADDHTGDPLHNGVRVLPNLPGYAALVAPFYAWRGRTGILLLQAVFASLTATLLYYEARRLFRSRIVGAFAAVCAVVAVPGLFYVGQVFPSTIAASLTFVGFAAVSHWLPQARGWRLILAVVVLTCVVVALPWLHFRYAMPSLALFALGFLALRSRLRAAAEVRPRRTARNGMIALVAAFVLSFGAIALYCRHYFGAWTPQVNLASGAQVDLFHPDLSRALWLFSDIFLSPQAGLLPWMPLYFLVPLGIALLWRRARSVAICVSVLFAAQMAAFASAVFSEVVYQGYAFPARFAVESLPLFTVCVAAVFAWSLTSAIALRQPVVDLLRRRGPMSLLSFRPITKPAARAMWSVGWQVALGVVCVLSLVWSLWCARIVIRDPYLWYSSHSGPRLVYKYPHALPQWWFGLFPETPTASLNYRTSDTSPFPYSMSIENGARDVVMSDWTDIPPGRYTARFSFACATDGRLADLQTGPGVELVIERVTGDYPSHTAVMRIADTTPPAIQCSPGTQRATMDIPFTSNGYERIGFRIFYRAGVELTLSEVSYSPK